MFKNPSYINEYYNFPEINLTLFKILAERSFCGQFF